MYFVQNKKSLQLTYSYVGNYKKYSSSQLKNLNNIIKNDWKCILQECLK